MPKTITVKGIGKTSTKPDYVLISMKLESQNMVYEKAMDDAAVRIKRLTDALVALGFDKAELKTTNFNIETDYNNIKDRDGNYTRKFNGYKVSHNVKLAFDFDGKRLSEALSTIGSCISNPELTIRFTVKDSTKINEDMLHNAAVNAKRKAEILCEAAGVTIGQLIAIDYNWGELDVYSRTSFDLEEECMAPPMMARSIDIEPEDIDVSDTATFTWEIC